MIGNSKDFSKLFDAGDYYMEQKADNNGLFNVYNPSQNFTSEEPQQPVKRTPSGYFTKNKYIDENLTNLGPSFFGEYRDNKSRYDTDLENIERLGEGWSMENLRAEQQSGFNKVLSGLAKGTVLAGTTFLEGTVGLPFSIASGIMSAVDGDSAREVLYNIIDNPFSRAMKSVNDWSEEILPNYYTKEEQDQPWWENIFTANFLGDKVFKVAGFTVGAALSGKAWAGGAARVMGLNKARNAFEGLSVVGQDGKKLKSLGDKIAAYLDNPEAFALEFTDELAKAATQLQKAQPILKWTGAFTGAIGEGKIEALNNSQEWFDKELNNIQASMPQINNNLMVDLAKQYPNDFKLVATDYNSYEWRPVTEKGQQLLQQTSDNYINQAINKLTQDRIKYANFDFVTNLALLTLTDAFTFGKVYQGGYNTGSISKKALTEIDKETGKIVRNIPSRATKVLSVAQKPLREGPIEEMGQSLLSDISAQKYGSEINDYFKLQIDPDAAESTIDFINALGRGFANTYGNPEAWEEGAIGALMGAMGTASVRKNDKSNAKLPFKVTWEGGIWEDIGNIRDYNRLVNEINVDEMNQYLEDVGSAEKKKRLINTIVSLQALENGKQAAIDGKDPKAYKDQENIQLIKLMEYFKTGGQLDMFFDKLDAMDDVTDENVEEYRQMLAATDNFYEKATKDQIKETIKKNVEDTKNKLKEYSKIADNLQTQVGDKFSIEGMSTLTYLASQIKDWDNRSVEIINQLRDMTKDNVAFQTSELASNFLEALNNSTILNPKEANGLLNTINLIEQNGNSDLFKQFLESPDGTQFKQLITDLSAIRKDRIKFINAYNKFINNPEVLNDELEKTKKDADNSIKKTSFENAIKDFSDATTIQNIQEAITNTLGQTPSEEDVMLFLNTLENSNAPASAKANGKRYKDLMEVRYQFNSVLADMNVPADILDDVNKLIGVTANASNLASVLLKPESYDPSQVTNDPERQTAIMDVINKLVEKTNEIKKHKVSDPKPQKFDDETIQTGPQKSQFETVEGIQQGEMPGSFMDEDGYEYQNIPFADEGVEVLPDFGLDDGVIPEPPINYNEETPEANIPTDVSEEQQNDPFAEERKNADNTRQWADDLDKLIKLPVGPESLPEGVDPKDVKVVISNEVAELQEDNKDSLVSQPTSNMVFTAIPQYDPNGFKGRTGKNKIFKLWKETLNKDSDAIIEDLSISQKDAYKIYEYLEAHNAFDIVNKIDFKLGPEGTKFYIGYDPNLKLSNGQVVPLIFAAINNNITPINMVKIPKGKWRTDANVAINKWLDIIQQHADKNAGSEMVAVNKKTPFYVENAFEGEVLYNARNEIAGNIKNITDDSFGYVKDGKSIRITDDRLRRDIVLVTGAVDGKHVLYVKTSTGRLIATPLSSAPLYKIFDTVGKDGKTPLDMLKNAPNDSLQKQLYQAARSIITAKNDGDYNQGYSKLSKIIRINFNARDTKSHFFWDKTFINFKNKEVTSRFENSTPFDLYRNTVVKGRQAQGLPIDEESIIDALIENMLFDHTNGLISNTDPALKRDSDFAPFTRLFINGSPFNAKELKESISRLKQYTFTNVGDGNTVRRNFTLTIPEAAKSDEELNDNNLGTAPVEPTFSGQVNFNDQTVNYNISDSGEITIDSDIKGDDRNNLLNLIEATEYFKTNPAAKTKQISNKVYTKTASGEITVRDKKPKPKQQPQKEQKQSSGEISKAGEYARKAQMALGAQPIGEIINTSVIETEFTIDKILSDRTITTQQLKNSLGEKFDDVIMELGDQFIEKYPSATITFEEYLNFRDQDPNQDFRCFGII